MIGALPDNICFIPSYFNSKEAFWVKSNQVMTSDRPKQQSPRDLAPFSETTSL